MRRVLLSLALVCLAVCLAYAASETVSTMPQRNSSFYDNTQDFLRDELPAILARENGSGSFVRSGGLAATSGSCTSAAFAVDAITSAGSRVTADGAGGTVAINYAASNIAGNCANPGSDTCWVVASAAGQDFSTTGARTVTTLPTLAGSSFNRVGTSNLYVDCSYATTSTLPPPALPADSVYLFKVGIVNGAVTSVTDLRKPSSFVRAGVYDITDPLYGAVGDGTTDDTAAIQAAWNGARGVVVCPYGNYKITSTLTMARAIHFLGVGVTPGAATSGPDLRFQNCALDHYFNGTFIDIPGVSGDVVSSIGGTLENIYLRQTYGNGSTVAGIAINVVATSDSYKASWVHVKDVNIENNVGSVDDWTWGMVMDADAATSTAVAGSRNHRIENGRWYFGPNSTGAIKIRSGANIHIDGLIPQGTNPHIQISGADAAHYSANTTMIGLQAGNTTLSLDHASGTLCAGCALDSMTITANTVGTNYKGAMSNAPTIAGGATNNYVDLGNLQYFDVNVQPYYRAADGGQTVVRLDTAAGLAGYHDYRDNGTSKWTQGKAADLSWFLTHSTVGNIFSVSGTTGVLTHKFATVHNGRSPTYGPTVTVDCSLGDIFTVVVTNNSNFTITATNIQGNALPIIMIQNDSGGAMGTITWDAATFYLGGAFTNPAYGFQRTVSFRAVTTKLQEISRSAADVAF